jgi:hypothetical protein
METTMKWGQFLPSFRHDGAFAVLALLMLVVPVVLSPGLVGAQEEYEAPEPLVVPGEQPPGPWPETVSGANLTVEVIPGSVLGGAGSDNMSVGLQGFGPIKWTVSRANEGDFATVMGMNDLGPASDPPSGFVDNYQINTGPTTHGWRTNYYFGIPLATVRVNGRDNGDTFDNGDPVGTFYGSAYFNSGFAQGWSYNMESGDYTNGGGAASDLVMGFVGPPDEASFDVSVAYFPFREGWVGGLIDGNQVFDGEAFWQGFEAYNKNALGEIPPVVWDLDGEAKARVELPDGLGPDNGMLFVSSTDPDSNLSLASGHPRDGGWDIAIRQDSDDDPTGQTLNFTGGGDNVANFLFLYIPYAARNLVGGHVRGADGGLIEGRGDFSLVKSDGEGQFELTIPGKSEEDGMLILSNAGLQPGTTDVADRSFLSYDYMPAASPDEDGTFVVQSREFLTGAGGEWNWPLNDTDFYFTWVDFANPLGPPAGLQAGDADQDFDFDQLDLVRVQQAAKYLTGQAATWGEGDWNGAPGGEPGDPPAGNGLFDQADIIAALTSGLYLQGPYAALAGPAPPEGETDEQTSIVYNATTGELGVNAPANTNLTSVNIDSTSGIFTGHANALNLDGSFDNAADNNIFKATFGDSFGSLSFGQVAQAGLSREFVLEDLTVVGSLEGGGGLGDVDLIYVPEPSALLILLLGLVGVLPVRRGRRGDI